MRATLVELLTDKDDWQTPRAIDGIKEINCRPVARTGGVEYPDYSPDMIVGQ